MKNFLVGLAAVAVVAGLLPAPTMGVTITNGLLNTDPNYYAVDFDADGYSGYGYINVPGYGLENVIFDYYPVVQYGGGVYTAMASASWTDSDPSDGSISASGQFGSIAATVTHSIAPGDLVAKSSWTLSQGGGLPQDLRVFEYLDEDVMGISSNILVPTGSIAAGDLRLLTVEPSWEAGVAQWGDAQATGWAADQYFDLESALYSPFDAAATGTIDTGDLTPHVDPKYGPAYGPEDITTAIEWEFFGGQASVRFDAFLGGEPHAQVIIPEPATMAVWSLLGCLGLSYGWRRRRNK